MAAYTEPLRDQADLLRRGLADLRAEDAELAGILDAEVTRQHRTLSLVSSSCAANPRILAASASALVNVTAEGTPGKRHQVGCENVDLVESLAIRRARELFGAQYASVQSHSASNANYQVLAALLEPGDTILGMALDHGGHLTHGSPVAFTGAHYKAIRYGTTSQGVIDYAEVRQLALAHRPRIIICGATAYSRVVDFQRFRAIADEAGAILLADISYIAGLVATGRHPSPIDVAHVTTACTHKQLAGPRGGLILSGRDADTKVPGLRASFSRVLEQAVFPRMQGAPAVNMIAAKAAALGYAMSPAFDAYMGRIRSTADAMASAFMAQGYEVVGGGRRTTRFCSGCVGASAVRLPPRHWSDAASSWVKTAHWGKPGPHSSPMACVSAPVPSPNATSTPKGVVKWSIWCAGYWPRSRPSASRSTTWSLSCKSSSDSRPRRCARCIPLPITGATEGAPAFHSQEPAAEGRCAVARSALCASQLAGTGYCCCRAL